LQLITIQNSSDSINIKPQAANRPEGPNLIGPRAAVYNF